MVKSKWLFSECIIYSFTLICSTLYTIYSRPKSFRTYPFFRTNTLLILTYGILLVTYCIELEIQFGKKLEQIAVTVEQFILLSVVYRTLFYQYYKTAYNIQLFTAKTLMLKKEPKIIDLLSQNLDEQVPNETKISVIVYTVFVCYSILVGLTYTWLTETLAAKILSVFTLGFTITIYGLGAYYFREATLIFKQASVDFGMNWNLNTQRLNKTVLTVALLDALIWSVCLVYISYHQNGDPRFAYQVILIGHLIVLLAALKNGHLSTVTLELYVEAGVSSQT